MGQTTQDEIVEAHNKRVKEQEQNFKQCFSSDVGKKVLKALKEEYFDQRLEPGEGLEFAAGQRDVILALLERVDTDE